MAVVVNVPDIQRRFTELGWTNTSIAEVLEGLKSAGVTAVSLVAYLDSLIAAPGGLNDQTITGCTPGDATKITNYLKSRAAVAV